MLGPGGHSVLIRGNAGTGKTTMALQMIEEMQEIENSFYFSTRVSDAIMLNQFPWLARRLYGEDEGEVIHQEVDEAHREMDGVPLEPPRPIPGEQDQARYWLNKLKLRGAFGFEVRPGQAFPQNRIDLSELEKVYSTVERGGKGKALVVIDSIDALAEACGVNQATVITSIQKDLVEGKRANAIFVAESNDRYLDYLGDGVVELVISDLDRRRLREMNILKLRGCAIHQPKYLYTLRGARMRTFPDRSSDAGLALKAWSSLPDREGKISLGLVDLDRLTKGGVAPGSIVLIELGHGVPLPITSLLEQVMVANFVSHGHGVLWVPLKKETAEAARARMAQMVPRESFDRQVRIAEVTGESPDPNLPCLMPVEGSNARQDLSWKNVAFALKETSPPSLSIMGFDTLESIYGGKTMDQLTEHFAAVKRHRHLFVGFTSPSTQSTRRLTDLASCHLKVERIGGTVIVYGVEPFTECNVLSISDGQEGPRLELVPII
ncbi:MAG: hypothetical protein MUE65_02180 [Methanomassiliicoccales archaeon]|nr:hypothetical protein [Methanomassiliicoccales archaeon]